MTRPPKERLEQIFGGSRAGPIDLDDLHAEIVSLTAERDVARNWVRHFLDSDPGEENWNTASEERDRWDAEEGGSR